MKKLLSIIVCMGIMFGLSGCGSLVSQNSYAPIDSNSINSNNDLFVQKGNDDENFNSQQPINESKTLVVYFSLPETTKIEGLTTDEENSVVVVDGKALGNTQYVAYLIAENIGADVFRIEPKMPYPTEHGILTDFAKQEQTQNARPELLANIENLSQYDIIFVGYPNWWGDMPMLLYSFFDKNDFSDKTIIPFNTHGGSGFSDTIGTISKLEPNATVNQEGFSVSRNDMQNVNTDIISWLEKLGY